MSYDVRYLLFFLFPWGRTTVWSIHLQRLLLRGLRAAAMVSVAHDARLRRVHMYILLHTAVSPLCRQLRAEKTYMYAVEIGLRRWSDRVL